VNDVFYLLDSDRQIIGFYLTRDEAITRAGELSARFGWKLYVTDEDHNEVARTIQPKF
jgi:hypothetical protein